MKIIKNFFLVAYYGFAQYLPDSYTPIVGKISNWIRVFCVKRIVFKCGDIDTIGRRAYFGNGRDVQLGDHCTLGANSSIPNNTIVGAYFDWQETLNGYYHIFKQILITFYKTKPLIH